VSEAVATKQAAIFRFIILLSLLGLLFGYCVVCLLLFNGVSVVLSRCYLTHLMVYDAIACFAVFCCQLQEVAFDDMILIYVGS